MSSVSRAQHGEGLTLRQAALIAGFALLVMGAAAPFADMYVYPKLVIPGSIERTVQNILANRALFLAGIFGYMLNFLCDVVIAWALYVLLIPVSRSLSLLAAWFRLIYTAIALVGTLKLVTVFRLLTTPDYLTLFGSDQLHAQVKLLLGSFRYEWSMSLVLFAIHLGLLGYLIYRSGYVPKILGILLAIDGLGWLIDILRPYLYPNANLGLIFLAFFGELFLMLWLLIGGRKIKEPDASQFAS